MMSTRHVSLFLLSFAWACVEPNAVLEVEMALDPPADPDLTEVRVQVASQLFDFDTDWQVDTPRFPLGPGCDVRFSVEAPTPRSDREVLEELRMKFWFCRPDDTLCTQGREDWRVTLEQPFYPGEQTRWRFAGATSCGATTSGSTMEVLEMDPDRRLVVDRCQILGCLEEGSVPAAGRDYCDEPGGRHPCD